MRETQSVLEKSNTGNEPTVLTFVMDAPRDTVFKAWTDATQLSKWWGPEGFTNPRCELDVKLGGNIYIDMKGPDGTVYPMSGVFREIDPPNRVIFSSTPLDNTKDNNGKPLFETLTTVMLSELEGKTSLKLEAQVIKATEEASVYISGMQEGWKQSLIRLQRLVESL